MLRALAPVKDCNAAVEEIQTKHAARILAGRTGLVLGCCRPLFARGHHGSLRHHQRIASIDPERDHAQIVHYLAGWEFPWEPRAVGALVTGILRTRGKVLRFLPASRRKDFITGRPQRSWPKSYEITDLGPPPLLQDRSK